MRIKKTTNGNQYYLTEQGNWVRDFTKKSVPFLDINQTIETKDHFIFLKNEVQNSLKRYAWIDSENIYHKKILIVSDGYDFQNKQNLLKDLPKDVIIFGTNGALLKWNIPRSINYFIVNNPYENCLKYIPKNKMNPKCIASARTNHEFLENYRGSKFRYYPVNEKSYTTLGEKEVLWQIDDYRNPICAAIGLAYQFGAEKIMLFCCDDAFKDERPAAEQMENGLWIYPQQKIAHGLIDGNLHWFKNQQYKNISIGTHSSGPIYKNASYIEEEQIHFFWEEE